MFHTILLGHLLTRERKLLLVKHNWLEGNHHPMNLLLLEDYLSMVGLPLPADNPFFMLLLDGNLRFPVIPGRKSTTDRGTTLICWKPFTILGSIFRKHFYSTPHWGALI
jgi:hypothetical protein